MSVNIGNSEKVNQPLRSRDVNVPFLKMMFKSRTMPSTTNCDMRSLTKPPFKRVMSDMLSTPIALSRMNKARSSTEPYRPKNAVLARMLFLNETRKTNIVTIV